MRRCFLIYATPRGSFLSSQGVQRALLVRPRADNGEKKTATSRSQWIYALFFNCHFLKSKKRRASQCNTRDVKFQDTHTLTSVPLTTWSRAQSFHLCARENVLGRPAGPQRPDAQIFRSSLKHHLNVCPGEKKLSVRIGLGTLSSHITRYTMHTQLSRFLTEIFSMHSAFLHNCPLDAELGSITKAFN